MKINPLKNFNAVTALLVLFLSASICAAGDNFKPQHPEKTDTCPVCGMFVSLYPDWTAWASGQNNAVLFFDGVKDMFKFIQAPEKWAAPKGWGKTARAAVTDYYTLTQVDAAKAFFVIGSDVLGPMGHELIPLRSRADAEEFLKDHKGLKILTFDQVTPDIIEEVDSGNFK